MKKQNREKFIDYTKTTTFAYVIIVTFIFITYWLAVPIKTIVEKSYKNIYFWIAFFLIVGFLTWLYYFIKRRKIINDDFHKKNKFFEENLIKLDEIALFLASEATAKYFRQKDPELYNVYPISYLTKFERNLGDNSFVFYDRPYIIEGSTFSFLKKIMDKNITTKSIKYKTFDETDINNTIIPKSFGFVVYADTNLNGNGGVGFLRQKNSFLNVGNLTNYLINAYYIIPLTKGTNSRKLELIFAIRVITDSELNILLDFIKNN